MIIQYVGNEAPNAPNAPRDWQPRIKITWLTSFFPVAAIITCLITLQMSVARGQVQPFPHCYITDTAIPTPQNIIFRSVMIPAGTAFCLLWITVYYILSGKVQSLQASVPVSKWIVLLGIVGTPFFIITIATIDSGKMDMLLHAISAVLFFVMWVVNMYLTTKAFAQLKKIEPTIISDFSLNLKWGILVYFVILVVAGLLSSTQYSLFSAEDAPVFASVTEWTATWALCLFVYTFTWDFDGYYYVLTPPAQAVVHGTPVLAENTQNVAFLGQPVTQAQAQRVVLVYPQPATVQGGEYELVGRA